MYTGKMICFYLIFFSGHFNRLFLVEKVKVRIVANAAQKNSHIVKNELPTANKNTKGRQSRKSFSQLLTLTLNQLQLQKEIQF